MGLEKYAVKDIRAAKEKITDEQIFLSPGYRNLLRTVTVGATKEFSGYTYEVKVIPHAKYAAVSCADALTRMININLSNDFIKQAGTRDKKHEVILGILLHEIGHLLYTDFEELETAIKTLSKGQLLYEDICNEALAKLLSGGKRPRMMLIKVYKYYSNCVEDGYIENRLLDTFPGYGECLLTLRDMQKIGDVESMKKESSEDACLTDLMNLSLEYAKYGIDYSEYKSGTAQEYFAKLKPLIDEALVADNRRKRNRLYAKGLLVFAEYLEKLSQDEQDEEVNSMPSSPEDSTKREGEATKGDAADADTDDDKSEGEDNGETNGGDADETTDDSKDPDSTDGSTDKKPSSDGKKGDDEDTASEKEEDDATSVDQSENDEADKDGCEDGENGECAEDDTKPDTESEIPDESTEEVTGENPDENGTDQTDDTLEQDGEGDEENKETSDNAGCKDEDSKADNRDDDDGEETDSAPDPDGEGNKEDPGDSEREDEEPHADTCDDGDNRETDDTNTDACDDGSEQTDADDAGDPFPDDAADAGESDDFSDSAENTKNSGESSDPDESTPDINAGDETSDDSMTDPAEESGNTNEIPRADDTCDKPKRPESSIIPPSLDRLENEIAEDICRAEGHSVVLKQMVKAAERAKKARREYGFDSWRGCRCSITEPTENGQARYQALHTTLDRIAGRTAKALERVIKEREIDGYTNEQYEGAYLDMANLYREDKRILQDKNVPEGRPDMEAIVLVDCSGSMSTGSRMENARNCAYITWKFCQGVDIPCSVYGHTTTWDGPEPLTLSCAAHKTDRKEKGERILSLEAFSDNVDDFAIRACTELLKESRAKKKFLFIISDGAPMADNGYYGIHADTMTRWAVEDAKRAGIGVITAGLGESCDQVKEVYIKNGTQKNKHRARFLDCTDVDGLPKAFVKVLKEEIL